jgi:REP element-mobilizing transposase RayT
MPQSLSQVAIHLVFSTKERTPWLKDRDLCGELYAYMATVLVNNVDSKAIIINGAQDHVHILCWLSRRFPIMDLVQVAKKETSKWMKTQHRSLSGFSWQGGYGAFSVSVSKIPEVKRYIENQEQHHQKVGFKDEFRLLCKKHGVEFDERYVWG